MNETIKNAAMIVANIINILESSSESEDEDLIHIGEINNHWVQEQQAKRRRVDHYVENVVQSYLESDFKSHFRMNRTTFEFILNLVGPLIRKRINNNGHQGREPITPEKQLLITLWTLATPDSYRSICDRFDVGRATAVRAVQGIVGALIHFKSQFIKWPCVEESNNIMTAFENSFGFPGVIGCVDGTHIKIAAPRENAEDYINRKNYHSIQLHITCDHTRKIIHCYVGQPGSMHDQRVFRNSGLDDICDEDQNFPMESHLLGDSAYSLHPHLLVPYRDNGRLTNTQRNYNHRHSSTRMVVERAIILLKGRWRILLDRLDMKRTDLIPYYIMACCVLHNICLGLNDYHDYLPAVIINDQVDQPVQIRIERNREAVRKRDDIAERLPPT